jgi:hypothetical protein
LLNEVQRVRWLNLPGGLPDSADTGAKTRTSPLSYTTDDAGDPPRPASFAIASCLRRNLRQNALGDFNLIALQSADE